MAEISARNALLASSEDVKTFATSGSIITIKGSSFMRSAKRFGFAFPSYSQTDIQKPFPALYGICLWAFSSGSVFSNIACGFDWLLYLEFLSDKFPHLAGVFKSLVRHFQWNFQARITNDNPIVLKFTQVIADLFETFINCQA